VPPNALFFCYHERREKHERVVWCGALVLSGDCADAVVPAFHLRGAGDVVYNSLGMAVCVVWFTLVPGPDDRFLHTAPGPNCVRVYPALTTLVAFSRSLLGKPTVPPVEGMLLLLFSDLQQQKSQISRRALAPVETTLVYHIRIKKRHLAACRSGWVDLRDGRGGVKMICSDLNLSAAEFALNC